MIMKINNYCSKDIKCSDYGTDFFFKKNNNYVMVMTMMGYDNFFPYCISGCHNYDNSSNNNI